MKTPEKLCFVDPQADMRARYVRAMKAHERARKAAEAAGRP